MFGIILPFLAFSASYPKFSVIYADSTFNSDSVSAFQTLYNDYIKRIRESCSKLTGEDKEACLAYPDAYLGVQATNSQEINTALTKVSNQNEFLLIVGDTLTTTINFANLPKQMLVFLYGNSAVQSTQSSKNIVEEIGEKLKGITFGKKQNAVFQITKSLKSTKNKSPKAQTIATFPIYGSIQSRVSYLTVIDGELKVSGSNLNCHSLLLSDGSKISTSSYQINTEFFIVDEMSFSNVVGTSFVKSNQYGIFLNSNDYTGVDFQISYKSDRWSVLMKGSGTTQYTSTDFYVPYSNYKVFNLIVGAYNFDINLGASSLSEARPVNITVTDTITMAYLPEEIIEAKLLQGEKVTITSSGNWGSIANKPVEIVTSDIPIVFDKNYQLSYRTSELFDYFNPAASSGTSSYQPTPALPITYPKFSVIYADATFDSSSISAFTQLYTEFVNSYREGCKTLAGEEKEFCNAYVNAFLGVQATNTKDINTALSKVSNQNEFLLIVGDTFTTTINFANLPKQMLVFLYGNSAVPKSNSKNIVEEFGEKLRGITFDKKQNAVFQITKALKSIQKSSPKAGLATFPVYGNIQSRVSFLTVIGAELRIDNTDLNCHSLFLSEGSKFSTSSRKAATQFFIVDEMSYSNVAGTSFVASGQYAIFLDSKDYSATYFQISYQSDRWSILQKTRSATSYTTTNYYVPYSSYQLFNLITLAFNFDIHLEANSLNVPRPVNITVTDTVNMALLPELLAEDRVRITSSGNWESVSSLPVEIITSDYPIDVDRNYQLSYRTSELFDYSNPAASSGTASYHPTPKKDGGGSSFGPGAIAGTTVAGAAGIGGAITAILCCKKKDDEDGGGARTSELFDNMNP